MLTYANLSKNNIEFILEILIQIKHISYFRSYNMKILKMKVKRFKTYLSYHIYSLILTKQVERKNNLFF